MIRTCYPITHNGKTIGTIDIPGKQKLTPEQYAFAKSLLMMCEEVGEKHAKRKSGNNSKSKRVRNAGKSKRIPRN